MVPSSSRLPKKERRPAVHEGTSSRTSRKVPKLRPWTVASRPHHTDRPRIGATQAGTHSRSMVVVVTLLTSCELTTNASLLQVYGQKPQRHMQKTCVFWPIDEIIFPLAEFGPRWRPGLRHKTLACLGKCRRIARSPALGPKGMRAQAGMVACRRSTLQHGGV